jgi:iron complex outermembrane receptor protein
MFRFSRELLLNLLVPFSLVGQQCDISITGQLVDESTGIPMSYATVFIEELQTGVASDENGEFTLSNLCPGGYHIKFNHIGCETNTRFIQLEADPQY